jgi:quercetin dioxygenase-like cupin family protein
MALEAGPFYASRKERENHMTLYRWNSVERKFTPTSVQNETPPGARVLKRLRVGKGQRVREEVATGELFIRMIEGAWRMRIANSQLTVRHDEAVIIPSGFSHSAEAIEDSFALQITDEHEHRTDDSLWAV